MFFGRRLLRERPGQHELGLEYAAPEIHPAVQRGGHPSMDGVKDPPLHVFDGIAGVALEPAPVEVFRNRAELDHQDAGQVLGFDLPSFLAPQSDQGFLVVLHNDPGVRAADEFAP
jgi:hypothetical protein